MSKTVIIELDFGYDDVHESDIYNYLNELMEQDCLDWRFDGEITQSRHGD